MTKTLRTLYINGKIGALLNVDIKILLFYDDNLSKLKR